MATSLIYNWAMYCCSDTIKGGGRIQTFSWKTRFWNKLLFIKVRFCTRRWVVSVRICSRVFLCSVSEFVYVCLWSFCLLAFGLPCESLLVLCEWVSSLFSVCQFSPVPVCLPECVYVCVCAWVCACVYTCAVYVCVRACVGLCVRRAYYWGCLSWLRSCSLVFGVSLPGPAGECLWVSVCEWVFGSEWLGSCLCVWAFAWERVFSGDSMYASVCLRALLLVLLCIVRELYAVNGPICEKNSTQAFSTSNDSNRSLVSPKNTLKHRSLRKIFYRHFGVGGFTGAHGVIGQKIIFRF